MDEIINNNKNGDNSELKIFEKLKILIICHGKKTHSNILIKFLKYFIEDEISADFCEYLQIDYLDIDCNNQDTKRCRNNWNKLEKKYYDYIVNVNCFGLILLINKYDDINNNLSLLNYYNVVFEQIFDNCKKKFRYVIPIDMYDSNDEEIKINNIINKNVIAKFI